MYLVIKGLALDLLRGAVRLRSVIGLLTCVFGSLQGQEVGGSIRGTVRSINGTAVTRATLTFVGGRHSAPRTVASANDGFFEIRALLPDEYTLRVTALGYRPLVVRRIALGLGQAVGLPPLVMTPTAIEFDPIEIEADRVHLNPVRTTVGAHLDARDMAALPGEGDYRSIIGVLPHMNSAVLGGAVTAAGSTRTENQYFIDGMNVTSTLDAGRGTRLPRNFIQAVEVKAGGYEAKFGKALGAVVTAVTYTGTNEHEANTFAMVTHDALAASPASAAALGSMGFASYDIGARIGGPVRKDALWYSLSYNPRVERNLRRIPGHSPVADVLVSHAYAGKLSWQPSNRSFIEFALAGDPTERRAVIPPPYTPPNAVVLNPDVYLRRLQEGRISSSVRGRFHFGTVELTAAVQRSVARRRSRPETDVGASQSLFIDLTTPAVGGGVLFDDVTSESRTVVGIDASSTRGKHSLDMGAELDLPRARKRHATPGLGLIRRIQADSFEVLREGSDGEFENRVSTAYLQDVWRITNGLSLSAGLRWSAQRLTTGTGTVAQTFADEWQPRLGFSWQPGDAVDRRVFGSYGRYYQQEPLALSSLWFVDFHYGSQVYRSDPRLPGATPVQDISGIDSAKNYAVNLSGVAAENADEFTVGYEHAIGANKLTVRGIHRSLRSSFQGGADTVRSGADLLPAFVVGTPGKGNFAFLPRATRRYRALEIGLERRATTFNVNITYVWSRTSGNYPGLGESPGTEFTFFTPFQALRSTGLLPSDRTHVLKLAGVRELSGRVTAGWFGSWQSGTPINDFGGSVLDPAWPVFLAPRGSVGRSPGLWDANLRFLFRPSFISQRGRVVVDLLHIGNPRRPTLLDERHYFDEINGAQANLNAGYLRPLAFQPPATVRLGFEIDGER